MKATREMLEESEDASYRCFVRRESSFPFNWHFHPEYELTLITRGKGRRYVGDNFSDYEAGDLVLLGPNLPHTWFTEDPSSTRRMAHEAVVVQFTNAFLGQEFLAKPELRRIRRLLHAAGQGLQFRGPCVRHTVRRLKKMIHLDEVPRLMEWLAIFDCLARSDGGHALSSPAFAPPGGAKDASRIESTCRHIHNNYTQEITLAQVAKHAGMTPGAFGRFFKRSTGRTLIEYVNELRIGRVCSLLAETDLPVTEICYQTGFNNLSHFNRKFLQTKGMNPKSYRKQFAPSS